MKFPIASLLVLSLFTTALPATAAAPTEGANTRIASRHGELSGILHGHMGVLVIPGHTGWHIETRDGSPEVDVSRVRHHALQLMDRHVRVVGFTQRRGLPDGEVIYVFVVTRLIAVGR